MQLIKNLVENPDYKTDLIKMRTILDKWIVEFEDEIPEYPAPDKFDRWIGKKIE